MDTFAVNYFVPLKVLNGAVLYRALYNNIGILQPYVLAYLFKYLGATTYAVILLGAVITLSVCFMLYKLSRFFLNRALSALIAINFLFILAFNHTTSMGILNFIIPYSSNSTLYFAFVLAAALSFVSYLYSGKTKYLVLWAVAMWAAFMCRIEMAGTVWCAFVLIGGGLMYKKRLFARGILYLTLPVVLSALSYTAYLYFNNAFIGFKSDVVDFTMASLRQERTFTNKFAGLDQPLNSIVSILKSTVLQILALCALIAASKTVSYCKAGNKAVRALPYIAAALAAIFSGYLLNRYNAYSQYKILNLIFVGGITGYTYKFIHADAYRKDYLMLLTLFLVSFVLTLRILLNYVPSSYGFYLLPMGLICYYVFFIKTFPSICEEIFNIRNIGLRCYYIAVIILIAQTSLPFYSISRSCYQMKTLRVDTNLGPFYFYNNGRTMKAVLLYQYLRAATPARSTLAVFPEGAGINLLAERDNPLKYYSFVPPELKTIGEGNLIRILKEKKLDYIAVTNDPKEIFGYKDFRAYAGDLYAWIVENYTLDMVIATPAGNHKAPFVLEKPSYPASTVWQIDEAMLTRYNPAEFTVLIFRHKEMAGTRQ
ncbi:MAG: hypothetical protein HQL01_06750 [Nitrospirae bacterium]|nr:hypothetical protein [Nitrospirota bacterium]